jgi:ParB/RepB/Spo0J family partition protein
MKAAAERQAPGALSCRAVHKEVPRDQIVRDENNRVIARDDDFQALVDSIRVLGILQDLIVHEQGDGSYRLVDGERRWHAAAEAGLASLPCKVWPPDVRADQLIAAGIVVNEQRKAASCIHVARRLREIRNTSGPTELTHEQIAQRTGLALDRVKKYFSLLGASEYLLDFFDEQDMALKVAVAFVRFEKATNEGKARRLAEAYPSNPLTASEIDARRVRAGEKKASKQETQPAPKRARLVTWVQSALKRDAAAVVAQLGPVFEEFGMRVVPASPESCPGDTSPSVSPSVSPSPLPPGRV